MSGDLIGGASLLKCWYNSSSWNTTRNLTALLNLKLWQSFCDWLHLLCQPFCDSHFLLCAPCHTILLCTMPNMLTGSKRLGRPLLPKEMKVLGNKTQRELLSQLFNAFTLISSLQLSISLNLGSIMQWLEYQTTKKETWVQFPTLPGVTLDQSL